MLESVNGTSTGKDTMMQKRTTILLATSAAGLLAVGAVGGYLLLDDPEQQIQPISLTGFSSGGAPAAAPADGDGGTSATRSVEGLEQLTGELRADDDQDRDEDHDDWSVAGVDVDFGPEEWLLTDPVVEDYDGDGTAAPLLEELRGLEGTEVTLGVRYEEDDDGEREDADVYTVNGLNLRDPDGGPAPWDNSGTEGEADRDAVSAAAEAAVGEGARAVDADRDDEDGHQVWDVEVHGADGREYDVIVDLSGEVVDVREDD
ncbi:PepSY domain-containing protein [Nocardiopsis sp. NPDC006139]|uniref:PepSY domain-containing protein n=1 Tax=Nocardiopsis sp. NPDC006139 TaxID=3154578 RepID=UPI0033A13816